MTGPAPRTQTATHRAGFGPALWPAMALSLASCLLPGCAAAPPPAQASLPAPAPPAPLPPRVPMLVDAGPEMSGTASWYRPGPGLHRTCTGEAFTASGMTAASHTIPLGTQVRVALLNDESRSIVVRVNDCMPRGHRILDLSKGAAEQLGLVSAGIARVTVTPVMLVDNR